MLLVPGLVQSFLATVVTKVAVNVPLPFIPLTATTSFCCARKVKPTFKPWFPRVINASS